MAMEMKEVLGTIIIITLASAGVFGILLVLIIDKLGGVIDKLGGVIDSLNSISANLHLMRNDTRDVAEMFEDGVRVEIEVFDEL